MIDSSGEKQAPNQTDQSKARTEAKVNADPQATSSNADVDRALDVLRRSVDLRIDAHGHWWHEGESFSHTRLIELFNHGLDLVGDDAIVRLGDRWCYIKADLTPFLVKRIWTSDDQLVASYNNGEKHTITHLFLLEDTLFIEPRCGRLARLSRSAQMTCAQWLDQDSNGDYRLQYATQQWPIYPFSDRD